MKKCFFIFFIIALTAVPVLAGSIFFQDVRAGEWFSSAVHNLTEKGIVTGYSDNTFRPGNQITRAEVAVMFDRMLAYTETKDWKKLPWLAGFEIKIPSSWVNVPLDFDPEGGVYVSRYQENGKPTADIECLDGGLVDPLNSAEWNLEEKRVIKKHNNTFNIEFWIKLPEEDGYNHNIRMYSATNKYKDYACEIRGSDPSDESLKRDIFRLIYQNIIVSDVGY